MTSPFMESVSALLAGRGLRVSRFEFAYMAARREGARKPPPKAELLVSEYEAIVRRLAPSRKDQRLVIGGKSMGGRVASLIANTLHGEGLIAGLFCLGYPFHPPGKPDRLRTAHLETLACPALIVQGERDPFGTRGEVSRYALSRSIRLAWLPDGDHDLKPRRPLAHEANLAAAADAISEFCRTLVEGVTPSDDAPSPPARARRR